MESKEEPESLEFCLTEWDRGGMKGGGLEEVGGAGGRGFIAAAGEGGEGGEEREVVNWNVEECEYLPDVMFLLTGGGGGVSSP